MVSVGNKAYGLEIFSSDTGGYIYNFCQLEKVKDTIHIRCIITETEDLELIKSKIKRDFPVGVVLTGKGILSKGINDIKTPSIQQFFPGVNADDFYSNIISYKDTSHAYLIRKKYADDIVNNLQATGFNVISLSFGLAQTFAMVDTLADSISHQSLNIHGTLIGISNEADAQPLTSGLITIGNESLPLKCLPAYCAALSYYLPGQMVVTDNNVIADNYTLFRTNKKLTQISLIFVIAALVAVSLSTIVGYWYNVKQNELNAGITEYADKEIRDSLVEQISRKKNFLLDGNWMILSRASFYADRIAHSLGEGLRLTGLNVYPKKTLKSEEAAIFQDNLVIVKGNVDSELILKNWIGRLKSFEWVEAVAINNYQWDDSKHEGEFEIHIQLKE